MRLFFRNNYINRISGRPKLEERQFTTFRKYALKPGQKVEIVLQGQKLGTALVNAVRAKNINDITDKEAWLDGLSNAGKLIQELREFYPGVIRVYKHWLIKTEAFKEYAKLVLEAAQIGV